MDKRKDIHVKTRKKSENPIVSQDRGNSVSIAISRNSRGEKGIPVKEATRQLLLPFASAESSSKRESESKVAGNQLPVKMYKEPMVKGKQSIVGSTLIEEVVNNLSCAFEKTARNHGAPGPDGMDVELVHANLHQIIPSVSQTLRNGTFQPGDIRRVWIPKSGGGERGLGIPNVIDRMVQEAVRMVIEPFYEPTFHSSSHGFRPYRSCHTAIAEAKQHIQAGHEWVVDIDLEKFFDQVNHQRLMSRLSQRIKDKPLLVLIGRMLKTTVVMPDGVKVSNEEGVPQGGPLSPLLANIVLSELDEELDRRGLRFVRYADDCNIYVRSERAGKRVMDSLARFISHRLRLRVNSSKSAVSRPIERHFLGFRLFPGKEGVGVLLSKRSEERLRSKVRELTPRNRGTSITSIIASINRYLQGWTGFFRICSKAIGGVLRATDSHIRRRLRGIILKHWKRKRTIVHRLISLGVARKTAWRRIYAGHRKGWALSHDYAVESGLRNAYFAERGLISLWEAFSKLWVPIRVPIQLTLFGDTAKS